MNIQTIQMDPAEAKARLKIYRERLHKRTDAEWQAIAKGYAALAKGTPVLNIADVFRDCPLDANYRPKLAIAAVDEREVKYIRIEGGTLATFSSRWSQWRPAKRFTIQVEMGNALPVLHPPNEKFPVYRHHDEAYALVPMVPPEVRPEVMDVEKHFVLWEVEAWTEKPKTRKVSRDPFLLRHIGGELYAVVAEWDLTELERSVVAGMRAVPR